MDDLDLSAGADNEEPVPEDPGLDNKLASPRPFWIPPDVDIDSLPEGLRAALRDILQPCYDSLVGDCPDAMERSAGSTYVFLSWLEQLEQCHLGQIIRMGEPGSLTSADCEKAFQRLHGIVNKKFKATDLLQRLRAQRAKLDMLPPGI